MAPLLARRGRHGGQLSRKLNTLKPAAQQMLARCGARQLRREADDAMARPRQRRWWRKAR
jgi:hypothetical protein